MSTRPISYCAAQRMNFRWLFFGGVDAKRTTASDRQVSGLGRVQTDNVPIAYDVDAPE
jgi:hypothetical protein